VAPVIQPRDYLGAERRDPPLSLAEKPIRGNAPALNAESPSPMPWTVAQLDTYFAHRYRGGSRDCSGPDGAGRKESRDP